MTTARRARTSRPKRRPSPCPRPTRTPWRETKRSSSSLICPWPFKRVRGFGERGFARRGAPGCPFPACSRPAQLRLHPLALGPSHPRRLAHGRVLRYGRAPRRGAGPTSRSFGRHLPSLGAYGSGAFCVVCRGPELSARLPKQQLLPLADHVDCRIVHRRSALTRARSRG